MSAGVRSHQGGLPPHTPETRTEQNATAGIALLWRVNQELPRVYLHLPR